MSSVSRRVASATLALAVLAVPTTALHALPADVEGAPTSWTAMALDYVAGVLDALRPRPEPRPPAAVHERGTLDESGGELVPWWDPNGADAEALQRPEGELNPWWDPNG